jgi:hypothetical protein
MIMSPFYDNTAGFTIEPWHSLTDVQTSTPQAAPAKPDSDVRSHDLPLPAQPSDPIHPRLAGVSPALIKVLLDTIAYLYSNVSTRIKRLNMSARAFEQAKLEGCEKKLIFESAAGASTYLIPLPTTFAAFDFPCPYERAASIEHAYYVGLNHSALKMDPAIKSVHSELKIGNSGHTSDLVTLGHDGTRCAYEVTLSTGNVLSNAIKYLNTDFSRVVFLCRDHKVRDAVKACCRSAGLDPQLLARLDFWHFSKLLRRQHESGTP